ncbi:hypothetical protein FAZ19_06380 [Sphingobacterium alkalisoli]|uniref:Uncharacterized protein n=1 Tax=Sphingobacterium alkalisoli TaxID=1874115 RepID=A0A4U0H4R1_9SPHI|nr:hypothetical protein [Sphingobacterium alkalisoli]TJY66546.1 hypothetical protein FAZ19_06380 [Sphingobacterium alkalisoli]
MKTRKRHIILYSLQICLMIFWLYVALDKLWGLKDVRYKKSIKLFCTFLLFVSIPVYHIVLVVHKRFPRKFALFPGRPVWE